MIGADFPAAYFVAAEGVDGPAPVMVAYNGLDSMKEMIYGSGSAQELARRGISTLIVDHPGSGEALRLRGLTGHHDSERWSAPVVDYLENRDDVDRTGSASWRGPWAGHRPVPHCWDHVQWVFGKDTRDEFMEFAPSMSLVGVVEQITVPSLASSFISDWIHDRL